MLHRLAIICITGFWVVMTCLLLVRELYPEATRLNAIPPGYVGQVVFQHEQSSDLRIFSSGDLSPKKEIGFVHIQPRTAVATGKRILEFNGSATLTLPGDFHARLSWIANLEMSPTSEPERLHLDLSTPEPGQHTDILVDFIGKKAAFSLKIGDRILNETAFTLDESGFASLMSRVGVPPAILRQLKATQSHIPQPDFSAQSSSFTIRGQKLETFLLVLKVGEQSLLEAQISQLGQVLSAQLPASGWRLTPFNLRQ